MMLETATTFYDSAKSLCKYVKTSTAHRKESIETVYKLGALLKDHKPLLLELNKQVTTLVEQATKSQETMDDNGTPLDQKLQSVTCMNIPFHYKINSLDKFSQNTLILCRDLQSLMKGDMDFYLASKRVVEPPTVDSTASSPVIVEPPNVRFELVGDLMNDPPTTVAKIPKN
jgi:hypothetical protein